jgi:predicted SprT family Zn-dependent metalloprotease
MTKISLPEGTDLNHLFEIHQLAESLLDEFGLSNWSVVWDRSHQRAGQTQFGPRYISLSAPLMALWNVDQAEGTIRHEIAHAIAGAEHGHDRVWKATAIKVGADPSRTWGHNGEPRIETGKYYGTCPNGHVHYRDRKTKKMNTLQAGTCGKCNRKYDTRYRIIWRDSETGMPVIPPPKANR